MRYYNYYRSIPIWGLRGTPPVTYTFHGPTWNFYTKNKFLREGTNNKFYFEFEFDSLPGLGLCYDYYLGYNNFQIVYFDTKGGWTQHSTIVV